MDFSFLYPKTVNEVNLMAKYEDLTHEDKQAALDKANKIMNPHGHLKELDIYINSSFRKHVNPYLNEDDLKFLIRLAYKGLEESK